MENGEGLSDGMERLKEETSDEDTEVDTEEEGDEGETDSEEGSEEEESEEGEDGEEEEEDGEGDEEEEDWETSSESSESDSEEEEEEDTQTANGPQTPKLNGQTSSASSQPLEDVSDMSDGESERCPVCLSRFVGQQVGMPETCDHAFCLECIMEWSKNMNTCPKDRQVYNLILVKSDLDGPVVKRVKVENREMQVEIPPEEEDHTCCEVCGRSDREDRLLLCDGCDLAYHCECLEPPLQRVPIGEWFCPDCSAFGVAETVQEPTHSVVQPRRRIRSENSGLRRRQIPRTLAAERVRSRIEEIRSVRGRRRIVSDSEEESDNSLVIEDDSEALHGGPSTSTSAPVSRPTSTTKKKTTRKKTVRRKRRKRKTTRKKTTKKRKTTTKKSTTGTTTKKTTTKGKKKTKSKTKRKSSRKRGRKKGKKARTLRAHPPTVKTRLAGVLGLKSPAVGRTIPTVRNNNPCPFFDRGRDRDYGMASLTILGDRDQLDPFISDSDEEMPTSSRVESGGTAVAQRRARVSHFSRASLKSHSVIQRQRARPAPRREASAQVETPSSSGFDLIGNIMMGQSLLQLKGDQVTIRRDGSLQHHKQPEIPTMTPKSNAGGLLGNKDIKVRRTTSGDNDSNSPADSPRSGGSSDNTNNSSGNNSLDGDQSAADNLGGGHRGASGSGESHQGGSGGREGTTDTHSDDRAGSCSLAETQETNNNNNNDKSDDDNSDNEDTKGDKGADSDTGSQDDSARTPPQRDAERRDGSSERDDSKHSDTKKGSEEYDPASPSESQDGDEGPSRPKSERRQSNSDKEEACENISKKETEKAEEYDPFAPTSDPEENEDQEESAKEERKEDSESNASAEEAQNEGEEGDEVNAQEEGNQEIEEQEEEERVEDNVECEKDDASEHEVQSDHEEDAEEVERDGSEAASEAGSEEQAGEEYQEGEGDEEVEGGEALEGEGYEDSEDDDQKMVPISELPRIPKLKRKESTENEMDPPPRSVLERASHSDKQGTFPRWEKRERAYRERDRGDRESGEKSSSRKRHKDAEVEEDDSDSSRRRRRHKHREHDRERSEKVKERSVERAVEYDSGTEEPPLPAPSSSSRHKRKKRSRSRSKERRRSRRSRSRSHERSRRRHERVASRSHSRDREEKPRKKRSSHKDSPDRKRRSHRSRSRSPHHRDRDHRDKEPRDSDRRGDRRSISDDFKGSVKMFSQSLKEASDVENTGRRFKLKRNFYQGSENQDPSKKYRYEDSESSYDRRPERPEVKSAVVKPVAVQELYDSSDDGDCEIIKVEYKGRKDKTFNKGAGNRPTNPPLPPPPSTASSSSVNSSISKQTTKPPEAPARPPAPPAVPHTNKTPQKQDTKVTFKLPDKGKKSTSLVSKKINIFESDDEEDYDPFDPTESSSPPRPKEPASPKSQGSAEKDAGKKKDDGSPPEPKDDKSERDDKSSEGSGSPASPAPPLEKSPRDQPKPPQTPPLPAAPPPQVEVTPRPPAVRLTTPIQDVLPQGARLTTPQNMVLQHVMMQPGLPPPPAGGRPMLMNHMMVNGPPPPPYLPGFPPGRMWPPNVILRSRLHPSMTQNGGPAHDMRFDQPPPPIPGMRGPGMLPTPLTQGLSGEKVVDLATPPPPLPHKALEEMEQLSQLLNARANKVGKDSTLFKVPMPPPPLPGRDGNKSGSDLDMEVVDMDVASPLSDDENLVSFSPPPLDDDHGKSSRRDKNDSHKGGHVDLSKDDDVPTSAVELDKRQKVGAKKLPWKYMKKLNRQERVVEEVKLAIKPHYSRGKIDKEEYKEILRKAVPKICHSKSGDINSAKIRTLIAAYVDKARKMRKYQARKAEGAAASSSSSSSLSSVKANGQKKRK